MFLHAKNRVARLTALNEELADLQQAARFQGRTEDLQEIAERRRQIRRLLLIAGEFDTGEAPARALTVEQVLARYS